MYCVADPVTEVYILEMRPDAHALNLRVFYAEDKRRYDTYAQMSEALLYYARQGLLTVGVFYGHPGVFVQPSHRAIAIATKQGTCTINTIVDVHIACSYHNTIDELVVCIWYPL